MIVSSKNKKMEKDQTTPVPVIKEILLDAPVERVWKAITDKDDMKQWYFDIKAFSAEPGFEFQFTAGSEEKLFVHLCKVTEVVQNKKLSYTWRYEGQKEETLVSFELFPEGNKTKLVLTHEGLEKLPQDKDFARENFIAGWNQIIGTNIKEYLEKQGAK
jgi:uncharacterized protein YndB with AHSA1/START domain